MYIDKLKAQWRNFSHRVKLGLGLIVLANLFLVSLLGVPFLEMELSTKGGLALGMFIIGEVLFYIGLFLVGKEVVTKYREYFTPGYWLKRKNKDGD